MIVLCRNIKPRINQVSSTTISISVGICIGLSLTILIDDCSKNYNCEKIEKRYQEVVATLVEKEHPCRKVKQSNISYIGLKDTALNTADISVSEHAYSKVRLLCLIVTGAVNHKKKAIHIKATWGKRCDVLLFASSKDDPSLPTIVLPVPDDWPNLWGKTKEAFKYVYENYFDEADWFFKADDDTFAIPENARNLLYHYDTNEPIYFGAKMKISQNTNYAPGGAGYILSKEALRRFVAVALTNQSHCDINTTIGYEDRNIASCLHKVGVILKDSRDEKGKQRFLPLSPSFHTMPGLIDENHYYYSHTYFKTAKGEDCCSDTVISFHHVLPEEMYIYSFFLYRVRKHGTISPVLIDDLTVHTPPSPEEKE